MMHSSTSIHIHECNSTLLVSVTSTLTPFVIYSGSAIRIFNLLSNTKEMLQPSHLLPSTLYFQSFSNTFFKHERNVAAARQLSIEKDPLKCLSHPVCQKHPSMFWNERQTQPPPRPATTTNHSRDQTQASDPTTARLDPLVNTPQNPIESMKKQFATVVCREIINDAQHSNHALAINLQILYSGTQWMICCPKWYSICTNTSRTFPEK